MKYLLTITLILELIQFSNAQANKIEFEAPYLYPEGVTYHDKTAAYYVSSVKTGTIGKVDAKGTYTEFYKDKGLKSTFGMKADSKNKLWVCVGDPNYSLYSDSSTFKKMARVIVLDLTSGKKVMDIDLSSLIPGKHFTNDIVFDNKGNAYVTDSFTPAIYKIDPKGKASVLVQDEKFKSIDIGLNGIVFHPSGYLLVAHSANGSVMKVTLEAAPAVSKVTIPSFFPGADGLLLDENNNLLLVQQKGVDKVFLLSSKDEWKSATVDAMTFSEDRYQQPTTATRNKNDLYVLNSKMNELADSTRTPSRTFSIQRVMFKPAK